MHAVVVTADMAIVQVRHACSDHMHGYLGNSML